MARDYGDKRRDHASRAKRCSHTRGPSLPSQANGNTQPASHALELRRVLESWLQKQIQEVVELEEPPPPDLSFFRMGVDSLRAVELANRLSRFLGSEEAAPTTLAFDYPTIGGLVQHIMDRLNRSTGNESTQVKPAEGTQKEPVAIIGLSCRFPGAADQNAFWRLLASGGNAISEVPGDRWDVDAYYNPCSDVPGTITSRWGGFLKDVDQFDAAFFGISPREAQELDPQQRMLLEQTWCPGRCGYRSPSTRGQPNRCVCRNQHLGLCTPASSARRRSHWTLSGNR